MIKLKKAFNYKGTILAEGSIIGLPEELEKAMIKAKNAERYDPYAQRTAESNNDEAEKPKKELEKASVDNQETKTEDQPENIKASE